MSAPPSEPTAHPAGDLLPWERQPTESTKAFEAFARYRDMDAGERSLRKVAEALAKSGALISRWSAEHRWVDRVTAYDADVDRRWRASLIARRRRATDRHLGIAVAAQQKIAARIVGMDAEKLTVTELTRLLDVAVRIERDALGEPIRHEVSGPDGDPLHLQVAEFAAMGPEQRRLAMVEMAAVVARRAQASAGLDDDDD